MTFRNLMTASIVALSMAVSAPVLAGNFNYAGKSGSAANAAANSQGTAANDNAQTINTVNNGSDLGKGVPTAVAPALTTTLSETCMGSTSGGVSGSGFGLSFGSTWTDSECVRRLNARELRSMGFGIAGKELMCDNDEVRAAFERAAKLTGDAGLLCQTSADAQVKTAGNIDTTRYVETANVQTNGGSVTTFTPGATVDRDVAMADEAPTFRRNPALDGN